MNWFFKKRSSSLISFKLLEFYYVSSPELLVHLKIVSSYFLPVPFSQFILFLSPNYFVVYDNMHADTFLHRFVRSKSIDVHRKYTVQEKKKKTCCNCFGQSAKYHIVHCFHWTPPAIVATSTTTATTMMTATKWKLNCFSAYLCCLLVSESKEKKKEKKGKFKKKKNFFEEHQTL